MTLALARDKKRESGNIYIDGQVAEESTIICGRSGQSDPDLILGPAHDNGTGDGIDGRNSRASRDERHDDDLECARARC